MTLDLQDLRYFLEVKSRGSLTAAARTLGVKQPSLTTAMQRLERHFGTKLLLRDRTGVQLTVTGRALAFDSEALLAMVASAERRILGLEDTDTGRFVIGCHESLGAYFLPALLLDLGRERPNIEVTIWNGTSQAVRDATVERSVDFGIVVNPKPHPDLVMLELFEDAVDFFTLADPSKPTSTLEAAFDRIRSEPLIHAGRVSESQSLIVEIEARGCAPQRVIACGDFELVKSITLAGVGVGILPRRVAAYGHEGRLRRLHPELPSFADRIYLVYRADMHKVTAAIALKDALANHGRNLRGHASPAGRW